MVPLPDVDPSKLIVILTQFLGKETLTVDIILLVVILFCIIMSAFFSATETVMSSSSVLRLHTLADEKVKGARKAIALAENFDKTVTAILIGNNIVNIGASTISGYIFARVVPNASVAGIISTAVMTFL
ncbi:MAG: CNNM domain-containing protein, partial [Acholeplasmataceae bacterium]